MSISRIGSILSSLRRVTWIRIIEPPTVEEVYEAISQLNGLVRSYRTLTPLSRTSDGRPTNAEHLLISQPTSEIGEESLSISQTIENDMQNLSILEPPTGIGVQSSQVDLLRTSTTEPHAHIPALLESFFSSGRGQEAVVEIAIDPGVWTAITNKVTQMCSVASLVGGESVQEDEPSHEQEINPTLHSESSVSHTLDSDSDTRNDGVRGTEDALLLKAFKMIARVMGSISGVTDIMRIIRATRTAPVPVMQPIPSEIFGTGTTPAAPNRPQPDNMQHPSISTDNNWRHPNSSGTPADHGSANTDFTDPITEHASFKIAIAVTTVVVFIILKRIAVLLLL